MRVCAVSDIHGFLPEVPPCDLLLLAGDLCPVRDHRLDRQQAWLDNEFRAWLTGLTMPVVAVWGNHDFIGQNAPDRVPRLPWHLLQDSATTLRGYRVYGSPWQPTFFDWAFNLDEPDLERKWRLFPEDADILVLHGPPLGYGDHVPENGPAGSPSLLRRIREVRPRLVVFGHIHEGRGRWEEDGIVLANVTLVDEGYRPVHAPMCFDLPDRE